jgi:polygalacturonase
LLAGLLGMSQAAPTQGCVGTIKSLSDVASATKCTTVNIEPFIVPAGKSLALSLLEGTHVNINGNITFASGVSWAGPLFEIEGHGIVFNGNGHTFNGKGEDYWDGKGGNGGKTKPKFMKVKASGTFSNLVVLNPPVHTFSISNSAPLTISHITVDVSAGDKPNSKSGSKPAAHNTDGFDVSKSKGLTITNCIVKNQDDCIAVNDASNLIFQNNVCSGGHGISIGSIKTGKTVSNVLISHNTIQDSTNALRIKTYAKHTDASVSDITFNGNKGVNISKYGVVIQQDYTNAGSTGKATNGIPIKNVNFSGDQSIIQVEKGGKQVYVLCGSSSCNGSWDWSKLSVSGGAQGSITGAPITGLSLGASSSTKKAKKSKTVSSD